MENCLEKKKDKTKCSYKICILLHLGVEVEKTMENHPVDPTRKDASSKRGPGEKHRTS